MRHKYTPEEQAAILKKTKDMANLVGGWVRISIGGTPHVVVRVGCMKASICYFSSWNKWRLFYPYGVPKQTKITCKNAERVVECLAVLA